MDKDLAKDFPEKKEDDKEDEIEMKKEVSIKYLIFLLIGGATIALMFLNEDSSRSKITITNLKCLDYKTFDPYLMDNI